MTALVLLLAGAATFRTPAPSDVVQGDVGRRVDAFLTRLVPFGWSGVVLVAQEGQIALNKGYGLANRAANQPWTAETVGSIGSITKQFTAAAILKLEAAGKLSVRDPISKYLQDVPADKAAITLHELLTHTAGFSGDLGGRDDDPIGRDDLVARVLAAPLAHPPGAAFEYSNEGYSLLAAIVERVSGAGYEQFLHDQLFVPAGMTKTGYLLPAYSEAEMAVGYLSDGREWGRVYKRGWRPDGPGWYLRGNGGIQSTSADMYRWHLALDGDAILPATERTKLFTPYVHTPGGDDYAYGWGVEETPRHTKVISHNGGNGIFAADFRRYVDEQTVIVAMSNSAAVPATFVAPNRVEPLVFNPAAISLPPSIVAVPEPARAALAGEYVSAGGTLTVSVASDGLEARTTDGDLMGALLGLVAPGGRFADLERRTRTLIDASAVGNFQPVVDAFVGLRTLDQVQAGQGAVWTKWRQDLGDFAGADVLGETFNNGDPVVVMRLRFARGTAFARYAWGPRRLLGFVAEDAPPSARLQPESPTAFVAFDYRRTAPVRLTFTPGPNGSMTATLADGTGRTLTATRRR